MINSIGDFAKLPKNVIAILCLISGILLFGSDRFLNQLGLLEFKQEYRLWIGIAFLFSLCISVYNFIRYVFLWRLSIFKIKQEDKRRKQKEEEDKKKLSKIISMLDKCEKSILREFKIQKINVVEMSIEDPSVIGLVGKKIIEQVGKTGHKSVLTDCICAFKITEDAMEMVNKINFEALSLLRPYWINQIENEQQFTNHTDNLQRDLINILRR